MPTLQSFKMNEEAEKNGVWQDVGGGLSILVARIGNPAYNRVVRRLGKPLLRRLRGAEGAELAEEINLKAAAKTVLLGWKNLQDTKTGEDIPYSEEKALELLKEFPEFYAIVQEFATDISQYAAEAKQDAEEN